MLWVGLDDEYLGLPTAEQARHLRHDVPRPDPLPHLEKAWNAAYCSIAYSHKARVGS
jgi:hypothetical protein